MPILLICPARSHVLANKIEVNLHRLGGFDTALAVTLMDKDFLDKFIEHGCGELERLVCKIYEDNALGRLPDARYAALDAQYAKEQYWEQVYCGVRLPLYVR